MGLTTYQIVKLLQLKQLGRKSAIIICENAKDETSEKDSYLEEFILGCIANKLVSRLPFYSK